MIRKLIWVWRASLCERLVCWSLKIAPEGYTPSYVEAVVIAHKGDLYKTVNG